MTILTLFPDTNIFIQCKPLSEVDWLEFGDLDRVDLLVARPVQVEIDNQKGKGSGRVSKRARAAAALFSKALADAENRVIVKPDKPTVRMQLCLHLRPTSAPYRFCGVEILPAFAFFDVMKNPDVLNDFARLRKTLDTHFG